jgi:bisphosphoglycerate-independent phosphoglycerate mutase (AlkP superfamily)
LNAVVYAAVQAGVTLGSFEDYQQGRAISADLTGDYLAKAAGADPVTPFLMGQRLAKLAQTQPFTMFDFWLSDEAGHRWTLTEAQALVTRLDSFLEGVLSARDNLTVLLTSDHGNLEDKTRKTHTLADVPLIVVGKGATAFADATSLTDVAPAIKRYLSQSPENT